MRKMKIISTGFLLFCLTSGFGQSSPDPISVQSSIQDFTNSQTSKTYTGTFLPVFSQKEDTKGNRYLFDSWVPGTVVAANNFVLDSSNLLFNYDKMSHHLFITKDKKNVVEVNNEEFKSFTFRTDSQEYVFKHVDLIDQWNFFQELVFTRDNYSLYKLTHTHLKRANYSTDGKYEYGNDFDEYVDQVEYFIIFPGGKLYKKIKPVRKSIYEVLSMERTKLDGYFSLHRESFITENFLTGLILSINK